MGLGTLIYLVFDGLSHGRFDVRFDTYLSLSAIATLVLLGCVLVRGWHERPHYGSLRRPFVVLVGAFAAYVMLSALTIGVGYDISFVKNAIIVVGIAVFASDLRAQLVILGSAVAAGSIQTILGLAQLITDGMPADGLTGYLPNHVQYGLYLGLSAVAAVALMSAARSRGWRIAMGGLALLMAVGVVASQARGALLALLAAAIITAGVLARNKMRVVQVVGAASVLMGGLLASNSRFASLATLPAALSDVDKLDALLNQRLSFLLAAWNMFRAHPIFGSGYGSYPLKWWKWAPPELLNPWTIGVPFAAHSTYLQILAELGVVGFALYLGLIGAGVLGAARAGALASAKSRAVRAVAAAALCSLLVFVLHGLLDNSGWHDRAFYIFLGIGLAVSPRGEAMDEAAWDHDSDDALAAAFRSDG